MKTPTIAFLSFDWSFGIEPLQPNGCLYYRGYLPNLVLNEMGWDCFVGTPGYNKEHGFGMMLPNEQALHGFDIVSFKLLMIDSLIEQIVEAREKTGVRVVVDVDDWFEGLSESNIAYKLTDPVANPRNNRENYKKIIELADAVITSTPMLYDFYSQRRNNVFLVRNSIDINNESRWNVRSGKSNDFWPTLGWVGATPWRSNDLEIFQSFLNEYMRENKLKFHHSGDVNNAPQVAQLAGIDPQRLTKEGMKPIFDYPQVFKKIDVGTVPLNDIKFNEAKCVSYDTLIPTSNGVKKACDIVIEDKVLTCSGEYKVVQEVDHTPSRMGYKITTNTGRHISITPEHRMWVNDSWVEAKDIKVGDKMLSSKMENFNKNASYVEVNWPTESRVTRSGKTIDMDLVESGPKLKINETWGRILGIYSGDGSCSGKTSITISCDGQDADFIDLIIRDFEKCGFSPTTEKVTTYDGIETRKRSVRVSSSNLTKTLVSIGVAEWRSSNFRSKYAKRIVTVPDIIFQSPKSVIKEFLSGIFETDGTIENSGVSVTTIHENFAKQIQLMLSIFGIQSKIKSGISTYIYKKEKRFGKRYYKISLNRASSDIFQKEINFLSKRKIDKLQILSNKKHSNAYKPMTWIEEVVSKEEEMIINPVDIQVDGEEYIANGLRSHNSFIKGLEYVAAGIPFISSALPEYKYLESQGIGRTASNPDEWIAHFEDLRDPKKRKEERLRNIDLTKKLHSLEARADEWNSVYTQILNL